MIDKKTEPEYELRGLMRLSKMEENDDQKMRCRSKMGMNKEDGEMKLEHCRSRMEA